MWVTAFSEHAPAAAHVEKLTAQRPPMAGPSFARGAEFTRGYRIRIPVESNEWCKDSVP